MHRRAKKMKHGLIDNKVVVIGAGPVGVATAAQLLQKGLTPVLLEKGDTAGRAMLEWGHVRVFTPWKLMIDPAVVALLEGAGWDAPDGDHIPTGKEIVEEYLIPATQNTDLKDYIEFGAEVIAISKRGMSKSVSRNRDDVPFTIHYTTSDGEAHVIEAGAVIDASGTWSNPNPIGADGLPVAGENSASDQITYLIPDTLGADRAQYEGKSTLVLGGGHSATNVILDLLQIREESADTKIFWGLRHNNMDKLLSSVGLNKELPGRAALGIAAKKAVDEGALDLLAPMRVQKIEKVDGRLHVSLVVDGQPREIVVDRIVVNAGFRPDMAMLRELRLDLDDVVEAPRILSPMIDPNLHSCGSVPKHGVKELSHTEKNFFIVGMKSYGRAPTFLMRTGYAQVRSITDTLAGVVSEEPAEQVAPACCGPEDGVGGTAMSCGGKLDPDPVPASCCGDTSPQTSCGDTSSKSSCGGASEPKSEFETTSSCCGSRS
ncbi:MAG: SidA/IucD/PvdA family monooxygenase [Rhodobacteraceae bacterium]|nr:SidA/IucD/PvdA family monooxygenase [Paracoccaceae bacterium]